MEESDGCSLLNPVYQNRNPVSIEDPRYMAYSYFHRWLYGSWASINSMIPNTPPQTNPNFITINNVRRPFYSTTSPSWYKDPIINENAGKVTPQLIKIFNDYLDNRGGELKNYKVSIENITQAQEYHRKTDNCVKIDGGVGTQTNQLAYPIPMILTVPEFERSVATSDLPDTIYYPIIWGNKRYAISISDNNQLNEDVKNLDTLPSINIFKNMIPFTRSDFPNQPVNYTYIGRLSPNNLTTGSLSIPVYRKFGIDANAKPMDLINPYLLFSQSGGFDLYTKNQFKDYNQTTKFSVSFASEDAGYGGTIGDKQISDDWFTKEQPPKPSIWPVPGTTGFQTPNEIYNSINGEVNKEMTAKIVTVVKKFIS